MKHTSNYPWIYYSRFKTATANDINLVQHAKDCVASLYEISTRTELKISQAYNLIFNHIPDELTLWMAKAAMTESPIASLSRLSGFSIFDIVENLELATRSESEFISHLINTSTPTLLSCLEYLLQ